MELHEQRLQCLKMAFELGGKPDAVLSAAQQLLEFVTGPSGPSTIEPLDERTKTTKSSDDVAPDTIAACGTALVMQESGDLADAVTEPMAESTEISSDAAIEHADSDFDPGDQIVEPPSEAAPEAPSAKEGEVPTETAAPSTASNSEPELPASVN
jgi:hypothetical protein